MVIFTALMEGCGDDIFLCLGLINGGFAGDGVMHISYEGRRGLGEGRKKWGGGRGISRGEG